MTMTSGRRHQRASSTTKQNKKKNNTSATISEPVFNPWLSESMKSFVPHEYTAPANIFGSRSTSLFYIEHEHVNGHDVANEQQMPAPHHGQPQQQHQTVQPQTADPTGAAFRQVDVGNGWVALESDVDVNANAYAANANNGKQGKGKFGTKTTATKASTRKCRNNKSKRTAKPPLVKHVLSRELSDTAFHRTFHRPLVHAFGRGNTRPVAEEEYMFTHNVLAAETNPNNVFPRAIRAATRRLNVAPALQAALAASGSINLGPPASPSTPNAGGFGAPSDKYINVDATDDAGVGIGVNGVEICMEDGQHGNSNITEETKAITPSHAPAQENMFEMLKWDSASNVSANVEEGQGCPTPAWYSKGESLRKAIGVSIPAGCRSTKSEAVASLLVWN